MILDLCEVEIWNPSKYLTQDHFDNFYITRKFEKVDALYAETGNYDKKKVKIIIVSSESFFFEELCYVHTKKKTC